MMRRRLLLAAPGLLAAPALAQTGLAQTSPAQTSPAQTGPERPVRLFVGFPPGGPTDFIARLVAPGLAAAWGRQVVVENRGGANAIIATEAVARSAPDGNTLLLAANNFVMNPPLYAQLPYDPARDFAPIGSIAVSPNVIWCGRQQPWQSLAELVAAARAQPGRLGFATTGIGGNGHYGGELLKRAAGIDITHVPYRGTAPAMQDVVAGLVPITVGTLVGTIGGFRNGQIRPLAVAADKRTPDLPGVPTVAELGFPMPDTGVWYGLVGPAGMAERLVRRMAGDLAALLAQPETVQRLASQASEVLSLGPEDFATRIGSDLRLWRDVATAAGIKPE